MPEYLQFKRGKLANLNAATITPGTVYITTDERAMYVDYVDGGANKRMRLGDYVEYATLSDLTATASSALSTTALYFVTDGNMLLRYTGDSNQGYSGFIQINPNTITQISAVQMAVANDAANNQVTIKTSVTDNQTNSPVESNAITIKGSTGATVSAADNVITVDVNSINEDSHYTPTYDTTVDFKATDATKNILTSASVTENVTAKKKVRFVSGVNTDKNGHVVGLGYDTIADTHATISTTSLTAAANADTTGVIVTNNVVTSDNAEASTKGTIEIVGSGATTVGAASNGKITINSTDTRVTAVGNHYTPTNGTALTIASDGLGTKSEVNAITGIKADAAGHITEATYTHIKDTHSNPAETTVQVTGGTNEATFGVEVTDTDAISSATINTAKIVGAGATTVSASGTTITVSSTDQSVTSAANHYAPTYSADAKATKVEGSVALGTSIDVVTAVQLDAKGHTTGVKTKAIKDTHATLTDFTLSAVETGNGFKANIIHDSVDVTSNVLDPIVKIGNNDTEVHFVNGAADLDVYTTTEVDDLITSRLKAADAMTFIGSLNLNAVSETATEKKALPTTNVNAGDTWIVAATGTYGGKKANVGDLFIALEDKESGSTNANWAYVPSGNDDAPQLTGSNNKIKLGYTGSEDQLGSVEVKGAVNCGITATVTSNVMTIGFEWGTF